MRRWIATLGSVRLTFWLVLALSALLFIGAYYAGGESALFAALNETRLQTWLLAHTGSHFAVVWWIFPLCLVAVLIAVNALCCLSLRVESLLASRREFTLRRLILLLSPSIVHLLFCLLLLGHLITFSTGSWQRVKAVPGSILPLADASNRFAVASLSHRYFEDGLIEGRLAQTTVTLLDTLGKSVKVSHLEPADVGGRTVILTMGPKAKSKPQRNIDFKSRKTCDKPPPPPAGRIDKPPLELLVVSDPGFNLIITAWFAAVVLMGWFFLARRRDTPMK